jgi:hypothetical protein
MSNGYAVDRERWAKMDIMQQMGNIASEVGRSISSKKRGDIDRSDAAVDRAIDLFDATIDSLIAQKSHRVSEVLRAREQYLSLFFADTFDTDADKIDNYFMNYAIAARS